MRSLTPGFALVAVVGLVAGTCTALGAGTSIADEQPSRMVTVRDVTARPGMVSGVLVNHSQKLLRDVRLLFHHTWLWADEFHPGEDSPGRADYYTVRNELPPGGTVEFSYRPEPPLPDRGDGRFETTVDVVGWMEVGR
ncbi:MAG: hypothetical protein E6J72_09315 [Deltaproteobacteria bacterium]|nr:MAG: hypothetical protein E6J72_09315 [Deltaproteobacteria bacterium]